jgi:E3 ubiquitin-protein ligase HUWE1
MLKPAQRVNNPKAVQSSFLAHQDKVTELAKGGSIVDLMSTSAANHTISMTFYKTSEGKDEGLQVINVVTIPNQKTDHALFWQLVEEYQIPKDYHFELLSRVRIANHASNPSVKRQLLIIRFISIVIMAHTMSDTIAQNRVFIYEPQLVPQIAQLVSYDNQIPIVSSKDRIRCLGFFF